MRQIIRVAGLALLAALTTTATAWGQTDFYRGKTISIVVGFAPGGSYDAYARLVARHIGRYIPGQPTVIVQNMPGAGTLMSVRHLDANAAKDGTVIAAFSCRADHRGAVGAREVQFQILGPGVDRLHDAGFQRLLRLAHDEDQDAR